MGSRRRRLGIVAFVLTPGVLVGGAVWTAAYALQRVLGKEAEGPCTPVSVRAPLQNSFAVNVLNAGAPQGAAREVGKQLPLRDFRVGAVGNDAGSTSVEGVGAIRHGPYGVDQALVVQTLLLPGASLAKDYRLGTSVDLVLGPQFTQLAELGRPLVRRADVTVNIYNTTYFEGLAAKSSGVLTQLGFAKGKVGLDPKRSWVTDTAVVRHGPDGELGARRVQEVVPGSRLVLDPATKGGTVDLLIGMTWKGVANPQSVTRDPPKTPPARLVVTRPCR